MKRWLVRGAVGLVMVGAVIGASVSMASAHVTIDTLGDVQQGSYAKLAFSVPNEVEDAGTVSLAVQLPKDHPFASVSVEPVAGWDITTTTRKLDTPVVNDDGDSITEAVDTITWKATGDTQIKANQFQQFWISVGPMPTDVTSLSFPAIQTYSNGQQVAWIQPPNADGSEAEHPAPSVKLVAASEGGSTETTVPVGPTATTVPVGSSDTAVAAPASGSGDSDDSSNALAVVALIVGGLGLIAGVGALVVARRSTGAPAPKPAA